MCGFIFGTICLFALCRVLRKGCHGRHGSRCCGFDRGGHGACCGHGGHGRHDEHEGFPPFGRGTWFRDFLWRRISSEVEATPAQEKALREAFSHVQEEMQKNREALKQARIQVAKTLQSESFQEEALAEAISRVDEIHDRMRKLLVDVVGRLHTTFDAPQRARLAELLQHGPFSAQE